MARTTTPMLWRCFPMIQASSSLKQRICADSWESNPHLGAVDIRSWERKKLNQTTNG